jgi:hypothetical protein
MTFHTLVAPQCTTRDEIRLRVSIIRLRGIAGPPGFTIDTALARMNPQYQGRYLRAPVPQQHAICAGES